MSDSHGRVDEAGNVYVNTPAGEEVHVGQYQAGTPEQGLAFYRRRYDELRGKADLQIARLKEGKVTPEAVASLVDELRNAVANPTSVGDLSALSGKAEAIESLIAARRDALVAEKAAAKAAALEAREKIVAEAESLAESVQWKATGDRFRELIDVWKAAPHGERSVEQELWKRFSAARSTFDKNRRQHFATLDAARKDALAAKVALVERAEALATSTDWNETARAYRDLMAEWKVAPRGSRSDEDSLWSRFRGAQDAFFAARSAVLDVRDGEFKENLTAKEALADEAEALLPITDVAAAKRAIRGIADKWEAIGHVPRNDKDRIEGRLRRVEDAIRAAEESAWKRSDPSRRAFAQSTVDTFTNSVNKIAADLAKAKEKGEQRAIIEAEKRLASAQALLDAAARNLAEFE